MSVSLIVLRLEIAEEFSLLDHLHFSVPKYNRAMALPDVNQKKVDGNEASSESVVKRYRGSRELRDISIETFNGDDASGIKNTDDDVKSGSAGGCCSGTVKTSSPSKKLREEKKKIKALKANGLKNNSSKSASSNIHSNGSEGPGKPEVKKSATEVLPSQVTATETLKNRIPSGILDKSTDVLQISATEKNPTDVKEIVTTSVESSVNAVERRNRLSLPTPVPFSSGNHFVDVTKGLLHLYKENQRTTLAEEAERSEMLCVIAVPAAMTTHDLLQFTAPANEDIEHMRIICEAKPNQYMVLIKFRSQLAADVFYKNFNGTKFNSIEPEVCHLAFVAKVETVKESEEACLPIPGHTELPTCPVCLERMAVLGAYIMASETGLCYLEGPIMCVRLTLINSRILTPSGELSGDLCELILVILKSPVCIIASSGMIFAYLARLWNNYKRRTVVAKSFLRYESIGMIGRRIFYFDILE